MGGLKNIKFQAIKPTLADAAAITTRDKLTAQRFHFGRRASCGEKSCRISAGDQFLVGLVHLNVLVCAV